jgi:TolB-like protein
VAVSLWAELKRRKVFRVGGAYVVIAWLVVQVASIALPAFEAPVWVLRVVILLLMLGFPVALVMAWAFDATPDGLKLDAAPVGNKRMAAIAGGLAVLALVWYFFGQPAVREATNPASASAPTAQPIAATATTPVPAAPAEKSVAVLAFADMSPGKDSEYLGDGIAEEILNALAKVEELKVAGRTSAFSFKGKDADLREIGNALGVAHVLEGSVRKQGQRLRITAQLIRVSDGFHLWSESFDGDDADIFGLQENIARRVTRELKVALNAGQQDQLVRAGTNNPEAYAVYLQASATFNRRDAARYAEAVAQLEQAVALDPGFARAYARLASLYSVAFNAETFAVEEALVASEKFARRAAHLDPTLAEPQAALAINFRYLRKHRESADASTRALALEPDDVTANFWNALMLIQTGYRRQGIAGLDRTLQLDPLLPNALFWRSREHLSDGELDQAERLLRRAAESGHAFVGVGQARLERARGNQDAAIAALTTGLEYFSKSYPAGSAAVFARACFGDSEAKTQALALIDAHLATQPAFTSGVASYVLVHIGEPVRGLALLQDKPSTNDGLLMGEIFAPSMAEVRRLPQFPEFLRRIGLAAYWDEAGAPEQCTKDANGDYHCD